MHSTDLFVIAAALVSAVVPVSSFATCSDADNEQLNDLYSAAAETSACAPYSTFMPIGTAAIYWPCDATDCQEVMAQVASDMPDCWYMGNNQKETLQEAIDRCAGETPDWTTTGSSDGGEDSAVTSEPSSSSSSDATDNEATTTAPEPEQENTGSTAASDAPATTAPVGDSTLTSTASTLVGAALCWSLIGMVAHA